VRIDPWVVNVGSPGGANGSGIVVRHMSQVSFRNTSVVGALTLLSRITGLAREVVYADLFGARAFMDAFLVAFKIPNFLRRLFAEGAFAQGSFR